VKNFRNGRDQLENIFGKCERTVSGGKKQGRNEGWLFVTVGDPALGQIVGGQLHGHTIAREDADAVSAEFAGQMGEDGAVLIQLHAEQSAGEFFDNGSSYFNAIFFAH
jgi:hypothetical protein